MASIDEMFAALAGNESSKQIAAEDPYAFGQGVGQNAAQVFMGTPGLSTRDRLLGVLMSGAAGGVFGGLSNSYQARAKNAYQDAIIQSLMGNEMEQPSELSPSLFEDAKDKASIFKLKRALELEQGEAATQAEKTKLGIQAKLDAAAKNPYGADKAIAAIDAVLSEGKKPAPISSSDNPDPMEAAMRKFGGDEATARKYVELTDPTLREAAISLEREKAAAKTGVDTGTKNNILAETLAFSGKQFDDAKKLSSLEAAIPGTTAANEFAGIQTNLRTKIQSLLGREMNGPEQKALMSALPDWNDTKEQIDAKKVRFNDLIQSVGSTGASPGTAPTNPGINASALKNLAATFPKTPEGRAAFKKAAEAMGF